MKIEYDKEADALYVQFREAFVEDNVDVADGVSVDLDDEGHVIGIEILDVSKKLSLQDMANITVENLPVDKIQSATA